MENIRWRYHPEFRIQVTVDGTPAGTGMQIIPSPASKVMMDKYGVIFRATNGSLVCHVKQHHNGVTWSPAIVLTEPIVFSFLIQFTQEMPVDDFLFFSQGTSTFGRRVFYANNLSGTGVIDSNLAANNVLLTPGNDVALTDTGSITSGIISRQFSAGTFTQLRVGKIKSGASINFSINQPIAPTQTQAGIDLTLYPKGSYVLRLEGGSPLQEKVFIDEASTSGNTSGVIEIFRTTWHVPLQPRNYSINFTTI